MGGNSDGSDVPQKPEAKPVESNAPTLPTPADYGSQAGATDYRTSISAMTPKNSDSAALATPDLVIDASTANALLKIDSSGVDAKIPSGGGPFQALRPHFTQEEISDHDLSKASKVIRDTRLAGHTLVAGETVPTGDKFTSNDYSALNNAELRAGLHMPFNATDAQVEARLSADNAASLRKEIGLPANATDAQVEAKLSADNAASLRKEIGLPANATDAQVQAKMAADNAASLRKEIGLPANATDADVAAKMAADNAASLRQELHLPANATDAEVQKAVDKSLGIKD